MNKVISGDYKGYDVKCGLANVITNGDEQIPLLINYCNPIKDNPNQLCISYEYNGNKLSIIDVDNKTYVKLMKYHK